MSLEQLLTNERAWRIQELDALRQAFSVSSADHKAFPRIGVVMLYAHWEGFVRSAATAYVREIARTERRLVELRPEFSVAAVRRDIDGLRSAATGSLNVARMMEHIGRIHAILDMPASKLANHTVKGHSSLNDERFKEICVEMSLDWKGWRNNDRKFYEEMGKIKELHHLRNEIAHGNKIDVSIESYQEIRNSIIETMASFADCLVDHLYEERYLRVA